MAAVSLLQNNNITAASGAAHVMMERGGSTEWVVDGNGRGTNGDCLFTVPSLEVLGNKSFSGA